MATTDPRITTPAAAPTATTTTPVPVPAPAAVADSVNEPTEVKVISHSNLFYWWPVWVVGFILGIISFLDGSMMAILPPKSAPVHNVFVESENSKRDAYVLP